MRKYRPLSSYVVKMSEVLAGEICMTPAPVMVSITVWLTPDDAAPTIAFTPACRRRSTVCVAVSVDVSPESPPSDLTS